jgi:hypothetical protein
VFFIRTCNRTVVERVMKNIQNVKVYDGSVYYILLKIFDLSINVHEAKLLCVFLIRMSLNSVCTEGHFQCAKDSR